MFKIGSCIGVCYAICCDSNTCAFCGNELVTKHSYYYNYYCYASCKEKARSSIVKSKAYNFPKCK